MKERQPMLLLILSLVLKAIFYFVAWFILRIKNIDGLRQSYSGRSFHLNELNN